MCLSLTELNYQSAFSAESRQCLWVVISLEILMSAALGIFDQNTYTHVYVEAFHWTSEEKYKPIGFTSVQAAEKVP